VNSKRLQLLYLFLMLCYLQREWCHSSVHGLRNVKMMESQVYFFVFMFIVRVLVSALHFIPCQIMFSVNFYDYFAECEIGVKWASANLLAWSISRWLLPSLGRKLLFVFLLTNAQLELTKRKMLSNGSANVKHSEIIIRWISAMYVNSLWCKHFFIWIAFKKNLEGVCCPSYEMNTGSWGLIISSKIINYYK